MTQSEFADRAGVARASQQNYESGKRYPDTEYLEAIASVGADVQYIITGVRSDNLLRVAESAKSFKKNEPISPKYVDPEILSGVIAGVDEYLAENKKQMDAAKKTELIMLLCDFVTAEMATDKTAVKQVVAKIIQLRR